MYLPVLLHELLLHHGLRGDTRVVRARDVQRHVAAHAVPPRQAVLATMLTLPPSRPLSLDWLPGSHAIWLRLHWLQAERSLGYLHGRRQRVAQVERARDVGRRDHLWGAGIRPLDSHASYSYTGS